MAIPLTTTMRDRMRSFRHIAQAAEAENSDYRPNGEVYVTRGVFVRHYFPRYPADLIPANRRKSTNHFRADWDEKYGFGGQPGQEDEYRFVPDTNPPVKVYGKALTENLVGPIKIPYINTITVRNSEDQNGIGGAVVTLKNAEWREHTGLDSMIYHMIKEGFFSPYYGGEDIGLSDQEKDMFGGLNDGESYSGVRLTNEDGKMITGLMVPNRKIEIFQGYGDELQRTFVGMIDNVLVDANLKQITLTCSDFGRMCTETPFGKGTVIPGRWPVAFGDSRYWPSKGRREKWPDIGAPANMILVNDITDIVGHILGWSGFQYFRGPKPGRIGGIGIEPGAVDNDHNAVFEGEAFNKGVNFIDGINRIKELLGYQFYITPEFWDGRPQSSRFRDPTIYNAEYSRYTLGLPHFVPQNVWQKEPYVEQYLDSEVLLNAQLIYDIDPVRNGMYVYNSGVTHTSGFAKGRPMTVGMNPNHGLACGQVRQIFYNMKESMGNVTMSLNEVEIFILMTFIKTVMGYVRGTITVPGHPGAKINDQCDILETTTGTWRRFAISGFESVMQLGPNGSYKTTFQVSNMDNVIIKRLKDGIRRRGGWKQAIGHQGTIRQTSEIG